MTIPGTAKTVNAMAFTFAGAKPASAASPNTSKIPAINQTMTLSSFCVMDLACPVIFWMVVTIVTNAITRKTNPVSTEFIAVPGSARAVVP